MMNKLGCFILAFQVLYCNCQTTTLTPTDPKIEEGHDFTFVCTVVSGTVKFVSWNYYNSTGTASYTASMNANKDACTISPNNSFLSNTNKYSYKCTSTVYRVTVKNVQRSEHNRRWSCIPGGQSSGPISTIKVQYKAAVTSFTINGHSLVTVDEHARVRFKCVADGMPIPTVRLTNSRGDLKTDTTQTLDYVIDEVKCLDADNYTCSASNLHNVKESVQSLQLYVRCSPRAADTVEENMKSDIGASCTFVFNATAYPKPTFTWSKWDTAKKEWNKLSNGGDIAIQSSNLQSSLTITKVGLKYFTTYKLEIENDVGKMTQRYTLSQYDKPETPSGLHHVEDLTTATSIYLQWKPGFNGGPPQTFHIKYKKSTTNNWKYINISDTGETIMRYTLTGLTSNTQYDIIIYASNKKGKSEESIVRTVQTKEETASLGPLIGGIVGGIAVLVIFIIVGIIIWRRYPICKEKQENKTLKQRSAALSSPSESESDGDEIRKDIYAEVDKKKKKQPETGQKKIGVGDIYAEVDKKKIRQPKEKGQKEIGGDIYAEVDRKKKRQPEEKMQKGKVNKNVEDTYENANINTNEEQKSKIVNKYGLNYADLVFNNKTPGEKTKVSNESVPYDAVDFTKKAKPLPDDDDKKA